MYICAFDHEFLGDRRVHSIYVCPLLKFHKNIVDHHCSKYVLILTSSLQSSSGAAWNYDQYMAMAGSGSVTENGKHNETQEVDHTALDSSWLMNYLGNAETSGLMNSIYAGGVESAKQLLPQTPGPVPTKATHSFEEAVLSVVNSGVASIPRERDEESGIMLQGIESSGTRKTALKVDWFPKVRSKLTKILDI